MEEFGGLHREEVKARIRMAYGSTLKFERDHGLPVRSVADVLRGRPNERVSQAMNAFLQGKLPPQGEPIRRRKD